MSKEIKLGETAKYTDQYSPDLLVPIPRSLARDNLSYQSQLAGMRGQDVWNAYELSWLDNKGKPQVAQAVFSFDCSSEAIIESKSFKYYLNSFNQSPVKDHSALQELLVKDLSECCGAKVEVSLHAVGERLDFQAIDALCVDDIDASDFCYHPDDSLLEVAQDGVKDESLLSHLLKSNCPVTGQPDWASVIVTYSGKRIVPESFLKYIVSFRQHQDYHENCVEKMYCDIMERCGPHKLSVYARYTRRGGLDINPFRSNYEALAPNLRIDRQ